MAHSVPFQYLSRATAQEVPFQYLIGHSRQADPSHTFIPEGGLSTLGVFHRSAVIAAGVAGIQGWVMATR